MLSGEYQRLGIGSYMVEAIDGLNEGSGSTMGSSQIFSPIITKLESTDKRDLNSKTKALIKTIREYKIDILNHKSPDSTTDLVRAELLESWMRSKNYGLALYNFGFAPILDDAGLRQLLEKKELLLVAADPYIKELENMMYNNPSMILLSDENGVMLRVATGEHKFFKKATQEFELVPGVRWSEDTVGTCAHVMTLIKGVPYQLASSEHYCESYERFSCSSAPIFDLNGNIAATLSIVSPHVHHQNSHSLGLVTSMAWAIQNRFQLILRGYLAETDSLSDADIVLVVNKRGFITAANNTARRHFSGVSSVTGVPVESLLGRLSFMNDVLAGNSMQDVTIETETLKLELKSARPVIDDRGNIYGLVLVLGKTAPRVKHRLESKATGVAGLTFADIVGESPQLVKVLSFAKKICGSDASILIQGETGVGKEILAQAIHNESRPYGPFVAINCAALPRTLIESELFGYEGGAFTGAERRGRIGKIEAANGGTLFLDEIGDLPLEVQAVLLRVLEEKRIMRVGGTRYIPVDFRLIAASNHDLLEMVRRGTFRQDLYYRLATFKIYIPPLRERKCDILLLAEKFIADICRKQHLSTPVLTDETKALLLQYSWPGNVRELQNCILYAINMSDDGRIKPEDLPAEIGSLSDATGIYRREESDRISFSELDFEKQPAPDQEKSMMVCALIKAGYRVSAAAKMLKVSRSTLYRKIKEYGLESILPRKSHKVVEKG